MGKVHARPFDDPRNTILIDNSDPTASNKLYAGIPGKHLEQRCCDGKPPYHEAQMTGWYVDANGNRICEIIEYWGRPENRAGARHGWWNAETPPGFHHEWANTGILMCGACLGDPDLWDEFVENLELTLNELLPVIEGVAIAASYFPVIGTAVSYVLNASVSLARGADLDEAALDAIGGALPGQPASGATYRAARTILRGGSIDDAALSALPVDDGTRQAIGSSVRIAVAVANGEEITDAVLSEVYHALPETGRRGVDVARRIIAGEDVSELFVGEATRAAAELARSQGPEAVNRFLAESGFQSAVETIEPSIQAALRTGVGAGHMEARPYVGEFDFREERVDRNDALAAKGQQIIGAGARWRGRRLADIRAGSRYTFTRKEPDPLTRIEQVRTDVHSIDDRWRRGFDVAVGLYEGQLEDSQDQAAVGVSLGSPSAQHGFDVGRHIQLNRTLGEWHTLLFQEFDAGRVQQQVSIPVREDPITDATQQTLEEARQDGFSWRGRLGGPS